MRFPRKQVILSAGLFLAALIFQPSAQQAPATAQIRINVNLVQVDAVVTDPKGKIVTYIKLEDF
jgi:hypothetical protein